MSNEPSNEIDEQPARPNFRTAQTSANFYKGKMKFVDDAGDEYGDPDMIQ